MEEFVPKYKQELRPFELSEHDRAHLDEFLRGALRIDQKELDTLRERIRSNEGLVRAFVHPFFLSHAKKRYVKSEIGKAAAFVDEGARRHMRNALREGTAPLILFEEEEYFDAYGQAEDPADASERAGIFVIPTKNNSGIIARSYARQHLRVFETMPKDDLTASEDFLAALLAGLGVKKLMVGGMYLDDQIGYFGVCVAPLVNAAQRLHIPVTLSKYHVSTTGKNVKGELQGQQQ